MVPKGKPLPIYTKTEMLLFPLLTPELRDVVVGSKEDKKKASELIDIGLMLGKCLYGGTVRDTPSQIANITNLLLPWNEKGTCGRATMEYACDKQYEDMKLFGEAMVQIRMTCLGVPYDTARHCFSSNKSGRVITHQRMANILQEYYNLCGDCSVSISGDGLLTVR